MRAAVFVGQEQPLVVEEVTPIALGPRDVTVRIAASGVCHCPVELLDTGFEAVGDVDRDLARRTRQAWVDELEGTRVSASAAHFPGMQFGRLLPGQGKRQWVVGP